MAHLTERGPIRVLIAEDQRLLRQCFAHILGADPEIEVVATAADGREASLLAIEHRPDLVLMDLEMPIMDGSEAALAIFERVPEVKVLILSRHTSTQRINDALRHGIRGYVLKDVPPGELLQIVKAVHRGERIESAYLADNKLKDQREDLLAQFTPRELEILPLLMEGMINAEIADVLFVSEQTIKRDMMSVCQKLGVGNRTQAAVKVAQLGLTDPDAAPEPLAVDDADPISTFSPSVLPRA